MPTINFEIASNFFGRVNECSVSSLDKCTGSFCTDCLTNLPVENQEVLDVKWSESKRANKLGHQLLYLILQLELDNISVKHTQGFETCDSGEF